MQRPNITTMVRADLGIMLNAAKVASNRSEMARSLDMYGMIDQFSAGVLEELDYRGETYNALKLSENMAGLPGIHVPTIYTSLSTSKIITQEFIKGVKVSDVEALDRAGLDKAEIARNALRALIKQLILDGFFHADPHPGNLLIDLDTGRMTFIDLGMMGELDLQKRMRLAQLMVVAQEGSVEGMASALRGHERALPRRGRQPRLPARLRAARRPLHGPRQARSRSGRSPTRGSSCCASTACAWTPTSRSPSRRSCRRRAWRERCPPAAASSRRACRCCATWRSTW